jgi:hypothetical protein
MPLSTSHVVPSGHIHTTTPYVASPLTYTGYNQAVQTMTATGWGGYDPNAKPIYVTGVNRAKRFQIIEDNSYWVVISDSTLLRKVGNTYVTSKHTWTWAEIEPLFEQERINIIPCSEFIELVATRRYTT